MSLAENLKTILAHRVLVESNSDSSTVLKEKNGMEVKITQMPQEAVATDLRKTSHLSCTRDGGRWKQICDYLLVFSNSDKSIAILIELKKTLKEDSKPKEQLRRSLPLLKYLHSVCHIEFNVKKSKPLTVRYFLIGEKNSPRFDKQPVKPHSEVEKENYKNIEIYTFVGNRISFSKLIC